MKKIIFIISLVLSCAIMAVSVLADGILPRVVDNADLLSESEAVKLLSLLDELSERQGVDVVVFTTDSTYGASAQSYADGVFEDYSYGMGSQRSCVLLMISMEDRDWHVTTAGYGITAVTDAGLDYLSDKFVPYLSNGDYYRAFSVFAEECDYLISRAREGDPYDYDDIPKGEFPLVGNLVLSLGVGFVVSLIIVGKEKSKLRSVVRKNAAKNYVRPGSFDLTNSRDIFLYKTVSRSEKPQSSGGSTTHTTKSGTRVGGGGGKF